jgi:hypothetical protein
MKIGSPCSDLLAVDNDISLIVDGWSIHDKRLITRPNGPANNLLVLQILYILKLKPLTSTLLNGIESSKKTGLSKAICLMKNDFRNSG